MPRIRIPQRCLGRAARCRTNRFDCDSSRRYGRAADSDDRPPVSTLPDGSSLQPPTWPPFVCFLSFAGGVGKTMLASRPRLWSFIGRYVAGDGSEARSGCCSLTRLDLRPRPRSAWACRLWSAQRPGRPMPARTGHRPSVRRAYPPRRQVLTFRSIPACRVGTPSSRTPTTNSSRAERRRCRCRHSSDTALLVPIWGSRSMTPSLSDRSKPTWCWAWSARRPSRWPTHIGWRRWSVASIWVASSPWSRTSGRRSRAGRLRATRASNSSRQSRHPAFDLRPSRACPPGERGPNSRGPCPPPRIVWPFLPETNGHHPESSAAPRASSRRTTMTREPVPSWPTTARSRRRRSVESAAARRRVTVRDPQSIWSHSRRRAGPRDAIKAILDDPELDLSSTRLSWQPSRRGRGLGACNSSSPIPRSRHPCERADAVFVEAARRLESTDVRSAARELIELSERIAAWLGELSLPTRSSTRAWRRLGVNRHPPVGGRISRSASSTGSAGSLPSGRHGGDWSPKAAVTRCGVAGKSCMPSELPGAARPVRPRQRSCARYDLFDPAELSCCRGHSRA